MSPLEPPDSHHFTAAIGWMELGNLAEAEAELAQISPPNRAHPDALEVRWLLCAERKDWAPALAAARQLVEVAPNRSSGWLHRAYAARRAPGGSVAAAREALLPAVEKFPKVTIIPFNLACYACQMRQLDEARRWLRHTFRLGNKTEVKAMALQDEDLRPLWQEIEGM